MAPRDGAEECGQCLVLAEICRDPRDRDEPRLREINRDCDAPRLPELDELRSPEMTPDESSCAISPEISRDRDSHTPRHTHTHTHTRTHKSCPCLPRRRPPPTPLARRAAQRRSCLSLWGGRRCAAPPSYTRDSTVIKGGARACAGRPRGCARCPSRALGRKFHVITIHVSVGPLTPPRRELRRLRRKK